MTPGHSSLPPSVQCAEMLLSTIPVIMQGLKVHFRQTHPEKLSVPQFRTLLYIQHHPGCALNDVADHLDVSKSAASGVVGRLQEYGLAAARVSRTDRRKVALCLTPEAERLVEAFKRSVRNSLGKQFEDFPDRDLHVILAAMDILRDFFEKRKGKLEE